MRLTMLGIVLAVLLAVTGCGTTMATRDLVHQTWDGARQGMAIVQALPPEPAKASLEGIFKDQALNMEAVADDVGHSEQPIVYSAEASKDARSRQAEELSRRGFWNSLLEIGKGAVGLVTSGGTCNLIIGLLGILGLGGIVVAGEVNRRKSNGVA